MTYKTVTFDRQVQLFQAELQNTYPALIAARDMWDQAEKWIDDTHASLRSATNNLRGPNWDDEVGRAFVGWADEVSESGLGSWGGQEKAPEGAPQRPIGSIDEAHLPQEIGMLLAEMDVVRSIMNAWIGAVNAKTDPEERTKEAEKAQEKVGGLLDMVAQQYVRTGYAMLAARGRPWNGPTQLGTGPGYDPDSGLGDGSGVPNAGDPPGEDPGSPDPGTPEQPKEQNPTTTDPVKQATETLSALSDALSAAEQLLGGSGGETPDLPDLSGIDPSKLGDYSDYLDYADYADYAAPAGTSGLPSLAGMPDTAGLSGAGGGGAGAMPGLGASTGSSLPGDGLNAGAAPMASGLARGTTGSAAGAGSGGMPPPMMPPNGAGKGENGGIKPGDAERPAGRQRGKPAGTPGVPLLGRAVNGKRKAPPAAPQRRWDPENNTVQLLDEELWQVNNDSAAKFRSGH
ncbi:hypothetical protein ACFWMR_31960 [Amycolatopsis thailandensis]|uniref:hypothetical protein n=1 Tax=Amycolatopsis thailandensis TaxID=589330 RepID=UPI003646F080